MNVKPPINVQDGFFYQLRKDNTLVEVMLLSEKRRIGRIRRFDKYAVVLEVDGREEMIYKHAIASVAIVGSQAPPATATPSAGRPPAV
jgi:host factor-I protein